MQSIVDLFEAINRYLGVSGPADLVVHPIFLGFCILLLLYALFARMKVTAIIIAGCLGAGAIIHYLYPSDTSQLVDLVKFIGAMGALGLVLLYFGFIRE
jgi:hypothetical protein